MTGTFFVVLGSGTLFGAYRLPFLKKSVTAQNVEKKFNLTFINGQFSKKLRVRITRSCFEKSWTSVSEKNLFLQYFDSKPRGKLMQP